MAQQYQLPGVGVVEESGTNNTYQVPGGGVVYDAAGGEINIAGTRGLGLAKPISLASIPSRGG